MIVLQTFWQLLFLKNTPETIPYSRYLLGVTLALHLLLGLGLGSIGQPIATALASAVVGTALLVGSSYLLLMLHGMRNRFVQAATAAAGCEILLGVLTLPIDIWLFPADKANAQLVLLLWLMLMGWNVAVIAHIWRHAVTVPKWQSFLYAIAYVIVSIALALLFQAPEG